MAETWVICGFLFPGCPCPQDRGDIPDTVAGLAVLIAPNVLLATFNRR